MTVHGKDTEAEVSPELWNPHFNYGRIMENEIRLVTLKQGVAGSQIECERSGGTVLFWSLSVETTDQGLLRHWSILPIGAGNPQNSGTRISTMEELWKMRYDLSHLNKEWRVLKSGGTVLFWSLSVETTDQGLLRHWSILPIGAGIEFSNLIQFPHQSLLSCPYIAIW
jgi:hypothetical protein